MAPSLPAVETVTLNTGAAMPLIGLGTAHLYREKGRTALRDALAAGYRHIDCAKGVERQSANTTMHAFTSFASNASTVALQYAYQLCV